MFHLDCSGVDGFCHPLSTVMPESMFASVYDLPEGRGMSNPVAFPEHGTCSKNMSSDSCEWLLVECINYYNTYLGIRLCYFKNHLDYTHTHTGNKEEELCEVLRLLTFIFTLNLKLWRATGEHVGLVIVRREERPSLRAQSQFQEKPKD